MTSTVKRVRLNLPMGELLIDKHGVSYWALGDLYWELPLEQAEKVLRAALGSVHTLLDLQGSGTLLTPATATGVSQTAGGVEPPLLGDGGKAPSPAPPCCGGDGPDCHCLGDAA